VKNRTTFAILSRSTAIALGLGVLISVLAALLINRINEHEAQAAVIAGAEEAADAVISRLKLYQYGLRGAGGAVVAAGEHSITRDAFHRYSLIRDLNVEFPGATGFGFIRRVPIGSEDEFLEAARADGKPDFAIHQLVPHAGERFVIQYIEPTEQNLPALGLDIASEQHRRAAAEAALRTGEVQLTAPITLVQVTEKHQQSFLILMPIYRGNTVPTTVAEREETAFGWSYAPLLMADVLAGLPGQNETVHLELSDITTAEPTTFYVSTDDAPKLEKLFTHRLERNVFGRRWQIEFSAHPAFIEHLHQLSPKLVLSIGGLISLLVAALVALANLNRARRRVVVAQQAWLAAIVESSSDGIIGKTLTGVITSWNKGAEHLFGYSAEDAVGKPIVSLIVPEGQKEEEADILNRIRHGERILSFQTQRRRRDGSLIDTSVTVSPIYGENGDIMGASKTVRDITAQKAAEAKILELNSSLEVQVAQRTSELSELNVLLSSVLNSASEMSIIATDLHGIIRVFNRGAERLLGYHADEVLNKNTLALIHIPEELAARSIELTEEYGHPIESFRVLVHKPEIEETAEARDWNYVRKDGSHFPVTLVVTAMRDETGQLSGYLGIAMDITAQRELEFRLRHAKEQADAANAAKSSFLANMSHEIRTPMNAVLGMLQLVLQTELNVRQFDYATKAQSAAKSLLGLLNDILDYSKIDAGKLQLDLHPFELEPLMRDLAVVLAGNHGQQEVEVMFDLDVDLPGMLIGDSLRLQQILINLAGNALKFTAKGQVVVSIKQLRRSADAACLRIAVTDTGIGISPEQLGRIFDSFTQAEASTTRRFGGTGLGLVICTRMVKLMGGVLQVDSQPDVGSRFWFDITLDVAQNAPLDAICTSTDSTLRILIADDNTTVGELLLRTVHELGWKADFVSGGVRAVERVREAQERGERYSVVLMDWQMPDLDGLSAAQMIRQQGAGLPPPVVIMITAYGQEMLADVYQEGDAPFVELLTKPVTPQQLANTIQRAIQGISMPSPDAQSPVLHPSNRLAGLRLLVVEDNMINRQIAEALLSGEGAHVLLAEGGVDGVNMIMTDAQSFDAVLMDIQMPDIDGLEATRRIRANPRFATLPIIAMTANASKSDRQTCIAAGMNEHVGKPIDLEQLITTLIAQTGRENSQPAITSVHEEESTLIIEQRASMIHRLGGNIDLIRSVLIDFGPELQRQITQFKQHIEQQDRVSAASVLHAIKGSAGTMGAVALSLRASQFEQQLVHGNAQTEDHTLTAQSLNELSQLLTESVEQLHAQFDITQATAITTTGQHLTEGAAAMSTPHNFIKE
jgi:PAS domain S-box-containing protein